MFGVILLIFLVPYANWFVAKRYGPKPIAKRFLWYAVTTWTAEMFLILSAIFAIR